MKVLAIVPCPHIYGLQIMTLRFFEKLSKRIEAHFLLTRWSDGEFARRLNQLDIPYSETWFGMFSRRLDRRNVDMTLGCIAKLPTSYRDVMKLVRTWRPDIIYMSNYHELILLWPVLMLLRIPIVCHVHNLLPLQLFYKCSARIWGLNVSHYVAVSESVRSTILQMGVDSKSVSVIYNGVDLKRFIVPKARSTIFVDRFGWAEDAIIVGMTGQMNEIKGHLDLIEAAKLLVQVSPKIRFVIGGNAIGSYYDRLVETIHTYNLESVIGFSGWEDDMHQFYSGLDIFTLPARSDEGFGLVIAEAMATGLPVVTSECGGATEVVRNGETGIIIERRKPEQLADAIQSLVSVASKRRSMGFSGRVRVEGCFSLDKQTQRLEQTLLNVAQVP